MIASLRGTILSLEQDRLVLEAGGVGYEVFVTEPTLRRLAQPGREAFLLISESFGMYGGGGTLYGFLSPEERALFCSFRDSVASTGAKKALEYLEKAQKSLPDFRRAILEGDARLLVGVFGFSKKTAERLVDALKDSLEGLSLPGAERLKPSAGPGSGAMAQALSALASLGYKPAEASAALSSLAQEQGDKDLAVEQLVRLALKRL